MDGSPGELEIEIVRETMEALRDEIGIKAAGWNADIAQDEGWIMSNYLLVGDKGCTIPEVFGMLRGADLASQTGIPTLYRSDIVWDERRVRRGFHLFTISKLRFEQWAGG
ncbi:MAG: hypothetical protein ACM65K_20740 [Microcoleus sp.]